ncbi:hypothetical protein Nepgr_024312 [Nepenthes gracilis]|uniref:C2 domain-containing protein n=1 Tax=Nepenthes gracilis TaxID=150966 RepID=A0AAD3XZX2_NEPGR|nr:hypothetical protein Nepgr_024312 [Nepenthes gracilis]
MHNPLSFLIMGEGILEVLVVNAEGIRHTNLIGQPAYYVLIQCGTRAWRSKTTSGYAHKAFWNQKCRFEYPFSEWKNLEHLKITIMAEDYLTDTGFVGEAIINLAEIIVEGEDTGFVELHPAPYNVVVEDDTFKGEIKIGLKFTVNREAQVEKRERATQVKKTRKSIYTTFLGFWKISWWKSLFQYGKMTPDDGQQL